MLAVSSVLYGYRLGEGHPGVYLSNTELEIVVGLLRNKSRERIVHEIGINCRTFDYCCCRLMTLMGYADMDDLMDALRASELYKYIAID